MEGNGDGFRGARGVLEGPSGVRWKPAQSYRRLPFTYRCTRAYRIPGIVCTCTACARSCLEGRARPSGVCACVYACTHACTRPAVVWCKSSRWIFVAMWLKACGPNHDGRQRPALPPVHKVGRFCGRSAGFAMLLSRGRAHHALVRARAARSADQATPQMSRLVVATRNDAAPCSTMLCFYQL